MFERIYVAQVKIGDILYLDNTFVTIKAIKESNLGILLEFERVGLGYRSTVNCYWFENVSEVLRVPSVDKRNLDKLSDQERTL